MLFESLAADAAAFQARSYLANGPHAEWCRNNWNENRRSIQFWLSVAKPPINSRPAEEKRDEVVVVVDDEPAIAITPSQILIRHGFPSVWLTDPCSAADLFEKLPLKLLITDIDMPGTNGVMLAALARKSHPNSPVLLFSARDTECEPAIAWLPLIWAFTLKQSLLLSTL